MPRPTRKDSDMPIAEILPGSPPEAPSRTALPPLVPDHIAQFLNSLPMTNDRIKWLEAFRDALQMLLGDVDRVVVSVDTYCDLLYPETYRPSIDIAQYTSSSNDDATTSLTTAQRTGKGRADALLEDFQRLGYPLADYHSPLAYDYYYARQAYLGTILLLRDKNRPPVSQRTIDAMRTLEPFLTFALSDVVTRHYYAKPLDRVFNDTLAEISRDANLSIQDFRILSSLLMGYSYKQVADLMEVSLDTIRKHIKRIYRKTRTGSLAELFAKYFTPRIGIQGLGEEDSL